MYDDDDYYGGHRPRGQSGLGIASLLLSLVGTVALIAAVGWATYMEINHPGRMDAQKDNSPELMLIGLGALVGIGGEVVALVLGIVALFQPDRSKVTAVLGVVFSAGTLALLAGLVVLGTLAG